jgi:hypothetical protein
MAGELTQQASVRPKPDETAFEITWQFDSKGAARAYKRFLWKRMQRVILIASAIAIGCLVAIFVSGANIFLILGAAYPAAYVVMWFSQMGLIDQTYEPLQGRKIRLLFDSGGISSYFGNTFKRVGWLGVSRLVAVGDFYFIYYERDAVPTGGFPKSVVGEEAMAFVRAHTPVID